ncbi:NADH-quinone oxidoreductase subunit C [Chloroflexota bacterium]
MTKALCGSEIADKIKGEFAKGIDETGDDYLLVNSRSLPDIAAYLKDAPGYEFSYLNCITAIDYKDCFELVYNLVSLKHNHSLILKTRCSNKEGASVPSLTGLWRGADYQEREIYDLFGILFEGHPNMKHILLWDGFNGHPLRKDYYNDA